MAETQFAREPIEFGKMGRRGNAADEDGADGWELLGDLHGHDAAE